MTFEDYRDMIFFRKNEHRLNGWNALYLKAGDLVAEKKDLQTCVQAMKYQMLEGDSFVNGDAGSCNEDLTICYYCDNLSQERRRIFG